MERKRDKNKQRTLRVSGSSIKRILFYKTERDFLNCPDNVGKEIHVAFKEVWRRYHLGVTRETNYRSSKDVEKELVRRRLERMERETPETEISFPESG